MLRAVKQRVHFIVLDAQVGDSLPIEQVIPIIASQKVIFMVIIVVVLLPGDRVTAP